MKSLILLFIRMYQVAFSPYLGSHCRYYPSCSHYAFESIQKRGVSLGIFQSILRILRCNPFFAGGYDPVLPDTRENS
ncbi:MAG: membrane protein insertion efficiency factor YidD [Candidatus Omnitrophica bacterium]|nr:membrane protein insertion efficiency factor YidD [Candidatus Omnitrophota bacterium]